MFALYLRHASHKSTAEKGVWPAFANATRKPQRHAAYRTTAKPI